MRTEQARPIRLQDYRPPDWLVDKVDLDVALHPSASRVRSVLTLRPNPAARHPAPLVLDGDGLTLKSLSIDGRSLEADAFTATPDKLTIAQRDRSRGGEGLPAIETHVVRKPPEPSGAGK